MNNKITLLVVWLVSLVVACATPPPPAADQTRPAPIAPSVAPAGDAKPVRPDMATDKPQLKDEELFIQGLQQLAEEETAKQDAGGSARLTFETLVNRYPHSKWREPAMECLSLLAEMQAYRDRLRAEQAAAAKASSAKAKRLQENEQLKKDLRALNEKYQAELSALQQENEQLKKDIQLLKNLEIELEKREKKLR